MVVINTAAWEADNDGPKGSNNLEMGEEVKDNISVNLSHASQPSKGLLFGFQDLASDYFQVRFWGSRSNSPSRQRNA